MAAYERLRAIARLAPGRFYLQPHLLRDVPADKSPDAVILPVDGFCDFDGRSALFAAQEVEDDRLLHVGAR